MAFATSGFRNRSPHWLHTYLQLKDYRIFHPDGRGRLNTARHHDEAIIGGNQNLAASLLCRRQMESIEVPESVGSQVARPAAHVLGKPDMLLAA